jgi:hypothetical protein
MRLNAREIRLAAITLVVVLGWLSVVLVKPRLTQWREAQDQRNELVQERALLQRLIQQEGGLNQRLEALRGNMPVYPVNVDVTAQLLRRLQEKADQSNVLLLRREPEPERPVRDLFELTITCSYEADLSGLVRFLYALQTPGDMIDVRQLNITPVQGKAERLRGTVTVDFAYSRSAGTT